MGGCLKGGRGRNEVGGKREDVNEGGRGRRSDRGIRPRRTGEQVRRRCLRRRREKISNGEAE